MENSKKAAGDMIDRYVYQVVKHLPQQQRADIEKELRGLIEDMLSARSESPAAADVETVLKELGQPFELAAKYRGSNAYLIGPEYFGTYWLVLRIVLACVAFGIALAQIISNISAPPENIWAAIGVFFAAILSGLVQSFAWVTGIFALIERFARGKPFKDADWKPSDLPPVPVQKAEIKKSEPIVAIVFSVLWLILITTAPHLIAAYIPASGEAADIAGRVAIVPVFNLTALTQLMPLVAIIICLHILKEALRLAEGRYTVRLAVAMTVINAAALILFIYVYGGPAIWNPGFAASINPAWSAGSTEAHIWSLVPKILVGLAIFGNVVDSVTAFVRALRHREPAAA